MFFTFTLVLLIFLFFILVQHPSVPLICFIQRRYNGRIHLAKLFYFNSPRIGGEVPEGGENLHRLSLRPSELFIIILPASP